MITGEVNMNIWAVGTDDGKSTYEIRRKWGDDGKKALVIELYPTIYCYCKRWIYMVLL